MGSNSGESTQSETSNRAMGLPPEILECLRQLARIPAQLKKLREKLIFILGAESLGLLTKEEPEFYEPENEEERQFFERSKGFHWKQGDIEHHIQVKTSQRDFLREQLRIHITALTPNLSTGAEEDRDSVSEIDTTDRHEYLMRAYRKYQVTERPLTARQITEAKRQRLKDRIADAYLDMSECRSSYGTELRKAKREQGETAEARLRFDQHNFRKIQNCARAIRDAEDAWSEQASEARRAGFVEWGAEQTSRFSRLSDNGEAYSTFRREAAQINGALHDWVQTQLDCFPVLPNFVEEASGGWRVTESTAQDHPAFELDARRWRVPEGFAGLRPLRADEMCGDVAEGRRRRHIDKWNVATQQAWEQTLTEHVRARPLKRAAIQEADGGRPAKRARLNRLSKRHNISTTDDIVMHDPDERVAAEAESVAWGEEPIETNVANAGTTAQQYLTEEIVKHYRREDEDAAEIRSLGRSVDDEFGEVYWTQPRKIGKNSKRQRIGRQVSRWPCRAKEDERPPPPLYKPPSLRSDRQAQMRAFDISRPFEEQGGL